MHIEKKFNDRQKEATCPELLLASDKTSSMFMYQAIVEHRQAHCCQLAVVLSMSCCGPVLLVMPDHQQVQRCSTSGLQCNSVQMWLKLHYETFKYFCPPPHCFFIDTKIDDPGWLFCNMQPISKTMCNI